MAVSKKCGCKNVEKAGQNTCKTGSIATKYRQQQRIHLRTTKTLKKKGREGGLQIRSKSESIFLSE